MRIRYLIILAILVLLVVQSDLSATSSYPPPANIRITNFPQLNNEEQVFICPTDSNVIIANWRDFRLGYRRVGVGRSTDGGQTWTDSLVSVLMMVFFGDSKQSDPTMTVDRFGNFYMSVLDWDAFGFTGGSFVVFYKSTDKGVSWTGPVTNVTTIDPNIFEDKQFITADRTGGPHDGNVYCSWTRFYNDGAPWRIAFVRSIDGAASFEDTIIVGPPVSVPGCGSNMGAGQFSIPVVSSNGDVHVFWLGNSIDNTVGCVPYDAIDRVVSVDGGQTFSSPQEVLPVSGWMFSQWGINIYSQPAADADISGGTFDGNIYVSFTNIGSEDNFRSDVDVVRSTDNGLTWSNRLQINDAPDAHLGESFHPWLIVNEEGVVIAVFYDTRFDAPSYALFDLVAAYSFDGGETFTSNHRISTVSSAPWNLKSTMQQDWPIGYDDGSDISPTASSPRAGVLGEYIGVTAFHDKINAVWTDSRHFNSEVYTANWYLPVLEPRLLGPDDGSFIGADPTFTWATAWKSHEDRYRIEISIDPAFSSTLESAVVDTNFFVSVAELPQTNLYWRVKALTTTGQDSSEYSETRVFNLDMTAPSAVNLLAPLDKSITLNSKPLFDWSDVTKAAPVVYDLYISTDSTFPTIPPGTTVYGDLTNSEFVPLNPLQEGIVNYWKVVARDLAGNQSTSEVFTVTYINFFCGDVNNDQGPLPNILDLTYLVDYLFRGGPLPPIVAAADVDGSGGNPNIIDLTTIVDYLFRGGPLPTCGL